MPASLAPSWDEAGVALGLMSLAVFSPTASQSRPACGQLLASDDPSRFAPLLPRFRPVPPVLGSGPLPMCSSVVLGSQLDNVLTVDEQSRALTYWSLRLDSHPAALPCSSPPPLPPSASLPPQLQRQQQRLQQQPQPVAARPAKLAPAASALRVAPLSMVLPSAAAASAPVGEAPQLEVKRPASPHRGSTVPPPAALTLPSLLSGISVLNASAPPAEAVSPIPRAASPIARPVRAAFAAAGKTGALSRVPELGVGSERLAYPDGARLRLSADERAAVACYLPCFALVPPQQLLAWLPTLCSAFSALPQQRRSLVLAALGHAA